MPISNPITLNEIYSYIVENNLGQPGPPNGATLEQLLLSLGNALGNSPLASLPAYGFIPANFPTWRKAVANARGGSSASIVLHIGTSLTAAQPGAEPALTGAVPAALSTLCNSYLCPSQLAGLTLQPGLVSGSDPRWTFGANATVGSGSGVLGMGGSSYMRVATTAGTSTYTPGNGEVDTFVIYYAGTAVTGTLNFNVDGGANQAVNTHNSTTGVYSTTYTVTRGTTHALNIVASTTSAAFVLNIDAYDSTQVGLRFANAGLPLLGTSSAWATTNGGDQSLDTIAAYAPQLAVMEMGADDVANAVATGTFTSNVQKIINTVKLSGDMAIWTTPLNQNATSAALDQGYNTALESLAISNSLGVADIATRFGPWTAWNALGYANDGTHPNALGNMDIAGVLLNALSSVA